MSDQPVKKFRVGQVTAAVWKNADDYSVTLQKSYKDGEEWKNTETLFYVDVLCAIKALDRAEKYIGALQ
jgi:hypothetical protein